MLKKHTLKLKPKPARNSELFAFASEPDWKKRLNPDILSAVSALLRDYDACLSRIRACRAPIKHKARQSDIDRILYSRGQEELYDSDTLYAAFSQLDPGRITNLRHEITARFWHLMDGDTRLDFLTDFLPGLAEYFDLFSDFRFGGYRILGDLICDIDYENNAEGRKQLIRNTDPEAFRAMMQAYLDKPFSMSCREAVSEICRELLDRIVNPRLAVQYVVALEKRDLLWELLPEQVERNVLEVKRRA